MSRMFSRPKASEDKFKVRELGRTTKFLKTPKKTYMILGRIFVSGGVRILRWFIGFLVAIDWFIRVSRLFSRCFWSKLVFR
jgi:hypothetical protein